MSAPASSARGPVVVNDVFRGQLHKKSEWSNSWSLRDVCLSRTKLIYTHVWRADPGVLLVADINQVHKILHDPCRFSIETSSRLLMHFRASKAEHCDQWVSRIQAAVVALQRGQQAASADGSTAPAEDLVPHDHLRVPIMIREGPEVVGRYKLDLPVRSSIYNLRELIADRLGLQPRNLVLEGFDGGIITHDKDLLAIIDAPASMMQRIVVTLPLNASPKSSISSSHASFEHDVAPENAEQGAQQVDSDISPSSAVPDDDLIVGQFDEDTDDAPPPAYDSLFSGVSQSSVASESSVDESNAGDTLSPLLQTTRAPSVPRSRTNSGDDRSSPTLGGGGIGVGDGRDFPRRDSFLEDTSGPQHVFSVTGGYSEGVIGSYSSPSMLAANMSVFRAHPSQADQQGQGPHSSRGLGPGPSDKRSPDDSGGTKDGVDLGPCEDDAPPQYTDIVTTPSTAGDLEKPAPTRPTSLGMQNLNSSEAARSSETGKASEDRHTEDLKYHEVKSPQGFCVTAIESFQNQRFIWLRGWVPLSTSYAQPDHSDFLGLQRVPRNANTFRSLTSRIDEIGEAALGASGDDIEYRWLDTWRLDIHCREAEWLQPAQTQPTSAPSFYSFQEYRDIIDPATGWVYAKRYEDFLQPSKCRRQPRAFDCQRRRRWVRMVHIQRKPRPESGNATTPETQTSEGAGGSDAQEPLHSSKESVPEYLTCPISGLLFEDPVAISNGHTYDREALTSFVEAHRLPQEDGEDGVGQDGVPLEFLDTPLPCHASVVKSAESSGHAQGGGQGVTAFMKEQVYPNLLAVAAVDEFNAQKNMDGRHGRQRSNTRTMLAAAAVDHYDSDDEVAYLLDPITYEPLEDPVCTRYGHTYSRAIVQECIQRRKEDPTCCLPLESHQIVPNLLATYLLSHNNL